jgi:hypothetical protein
MWRISAINADFPTAFAAVVTSDCSYRFLGVTRIRG